MSDAPNALPVTIVSPDTELLRELAWLLSTFGYDAVASSDLSEEAIWRRATRPGMLLLDARDQQVALAALAAPRGGAYVYQVCLHEEDADPSLLLSAGAEDMLRVPVSRGELLARLRAGARRLELERRMAALATRDATTGLSTKRGLVRRLGKISPEQRLRTPGVLVATAIDWVGHIRAQSGSRSVQRLVTALAKGFEKHLGKNDICAVVGDGELCAVLLGRSEGEARELAESVAAEFSCRDTLVRETRSRPTVSSAILAWDDEASAEEFVDQGLTALTHVKNYGGNTVVAAEAVENEVRAWRTEMVSGNPFVGVVAQDVMESFPAVEEMEHASGSLPAPAALVDQDGRVVRLAGDDPYAASSEPAPTVGHDLPLGDLFQKFAEGTAQYLVVEREGRPMGYITRDGLASLIDPVTEDSFRQDAEDAAALASLVVPCEPVDSLAV